MAFPNGPHEIAVVEALNAKGYAKLPPEIKGRIVELCKMGLPPSHIADHCHRCFNWKDISDAISATDDLDESDLADLRRSYLDKSMNARQIHAKAKALKAAKERKKTTAAPRGGKAKPTSGRQ